MAINFTFLVKTVILKLVFMLHKEVAICSLFIYLCLFISDNIHSLWGVSQIIINDRLWFLIGTLQLIIKSTPTQQPPKEKLTRSLSQWVTELWVWPISCRENDNKIDDIFLCWFLFSDFLRWDPKKNQPFKFDTFKANKHNSSHFTSLHLSLLMNLFWIVPPFPK